jgi:hypothetical protein
VHPRVRLPLVAAVSVAAVVAIAITVELLVLRPWQDGPPAPGSGGCHGAGPLSSTLLVGNSYTAANDLAHLLGDVLCKSGIASNVRVEALTAGGATMRAWVDDGAGARMAGHDVVVLQEQSETPGFYGASTLYETSVAAIDTLAADARTARARVVLFETWGRPDGDPADPILYPTYEAMQQRITAGYARYLRSLQAGPAPDATAARVGSAWEWVYTHDRSLFASLYQSDGSHPSVAGSYLAALVLARAISQDALPERVWKPDEVSAADARELAVAAGHS